MLQGVTYHSVWSWEVVSRRGPARAPTLQTPKTVGSMRAPARSQVSTCQSRTQTIISSSNLRRHSGTEDVLWCLGLSKWPSAGPESEVLDILILSWALSSPLLRLHSGWSVKTATINQWKQPEPLTTSEQQMIVDVIKRAEQMEKAEKTRLE